MASQSADPGGKKNQDRPYVPLSHPFVERLIGTIRREYLDHMVFWTSADLENKLLDFRTYYNHHRTHHAREGRTPTRPSHTPSQICARFAGNLTLEAYTRHRWLPAFQRRALPAISRSPWAKT